MGGRVMGKYILHSGVITLSMANKVKLDLIKVVHVMKPLTGIFLFISSILQRRAALGELVLTSLPKACTGRVLLEVRLELITLRFCF